MPVERVLDSPPSLLPLFARSAAGLIPGSSRLPFIAGGGREMPDVVLTLPSVSVDHERLAAYDRVCGFALCDLLPPTYIHILAFPLHLALMTDPGFPFPALGLVHIGNEITHHRPVEAREQLSLRVWPTPVQPHPRGRQFSLRTEARVGEELVWEEVSTILKRGGSGSAGEPGQSGGSASAARPSRPERDELPATAEERQVRRARDHRRAGAGEQRQHRGRAMQLAGGHHAPTRLCPHTRTTVPFRPPEAGLAYQAIVSATSTGSPP